jgi:hypothetical protein
MLSHAPHSIEVVISAEAWLAEAADLLAFDRSVHEAEDVAVGGQTVRLLVTGDSERCRRAQPEVALRYQRLSPRYNALSRGSLFASVCSRHRALHPLHKPLVRADYDHAVDVWQWVLRLASSASLELQIAALFHDIERLWSEADVRVEHTARDYPAFKAEHARRGALITRQALLGLPIEAQSVQRVERLVSCHERPQADPELRLLNDADALSFFALNSPGFVRYYDAAHSAKKIAYTLARMSSAARAWLPAIRLDPTVSQLLQRATAQQA